MPRFNFKNQEDIDAFSKRLQVQQEKVATQFEQDKTNNKE